jgi:cysteinyl-tRNA synthetase
MLAHFRAEMNNDFNSPGAVSLLFELVSEVNRGQSPVLARQLKELSAILQIGRSMAGEVDAEIIVLVEQRDAARRNRDFIEADRLRDLLETRGFQVRDTPEGTRIRRA